jgi:uncharacterized protein YjbI with pentapeptide repeats
MTEEKHFITQEEFNEIYEKHQLWLKSEGKEGEQADLSNLNFNKINFPSNSNLEKAILTSSIFKRVNMEGAILKNALLNNSLFYLSNLRHSTFFNTDLSETTFLKCDLTRAYFFNAILDRTDFTESKLILASINSSYVVNSPSFLRTDITDTKMHYPLREKALSSGAIDHNNFVKSQLFPDYTIHELGADDIAKKDLENIHKQLSFLSYKKKEQEKIVEEKTHELNALKARIEKINESREQDNEENLQLKAEVDKLTDSISKLNEENSSKNKIIEEKEKEYQKKIDEITQRGKDIESGLATAFEALKSVNEIIKPEIWRLKIMFCSFSFFTVIFLTVLATIWSIAFKELHGVDIEISRIWIYTAPSLILVGFIWACITQMNRAQRQLVTLRKYNRKYEVIKIALEGYYRVEDKLNKTPDKAKETFDEIIKQSMCENINTDKEEDTIKQNASRDQIPAKEVIDQLISYLQKIKGLQ